MELQFIGTGLARTGTMSLKMALEQLEGKSCFHMIDLFQAPQRAGIIKKGYKTNTIDWSAFYEGYGSAVDYPTCLYYPELLALNPELKVIHTTRDFDSWYTSVLATVYRGKPKTAGAIFRMIKNMMFSSDFRRVAPVFMLNDKLIWQGQFEDKFEDLEFMREKYRQHEEEVRNSVPEENLLLYNIKDGWRPLCEFLNKPIPNAAFPKLNERKEFNRKMDRLLIDGVFEA